MAPDKPVDGMGEVIPFERYFSPSGRNSHHMAPQQGVVQVASNAVLNTLMEHWEAPESASEAKAWVNRPNLVVDLVDNRADLLDAIRRLGLEAFVVNGKRADACTSNAPVSLDAFWDIDELYLEEAAVRFALPSVFSDTSVCNQRWLALCMWPHFVGKNVAGDSAHNQVVVQHRFLRVDKSAIWYAPDTLENYGPVSPWTFVHPNSYRYRQGFLV